MTKAAKTITYAAGIFTAFWLFLSFRGTPFDYF